MRPVPEGTLSADNARRARTVKSGRNLGQVSPESWSSVAGSVLVKCDRNPGQVSPDFAVGNALMDYLLKVRPDAGAQRALFLTLQAPFRPLTSGAIGMIVRSRANRLGIAGKRLGAHALRHAAAQRLVDEGCALKTVGDFLGQARARQPHHKPIALDLRSICVRFATH